jgi:diguanylate cyclase (GGDEF)-like protein
MFLDLDRFKEINDTLGHDIGDELLKEVAKRLELCVRGGDTVSRQGGDEFVIILSEISRQQDAALVAEKILEVLSSTITIQGHKLKITTSIGIVIYTVDSADDAMKLLKKADVAMYQAKGAGRNTFRFYSDCQEVSESRAILSLSQGDEPDWN